MSQKLDNQENKNDNGESPVIEHDHIIPPEKGEEIIIHKPPKPNKDGVVFPQFKDILIGKPNEG